MLTTPSSSELRSLWFDLEYLTKKALDPEKKEKHLEEIEEIYRRYKAILVETNQDWQKVRIEEQPKTEKLPSDKSS